MKRQTKSLKKRLTAKNFTWDDLIAISHAVIHAREEAFEQAEGWRLEGLHRRALLFEQYGASYNRILIRMGHPAAIEE